MKKKLLATMLCMSMAAAALAGCGGSSDSGSGDTQTTDGTETEATETESTGDATYKVGVIQLVQHPALDAATQGFQDALKDKLGDAVDITVQNAAGESANCATIANTYVSDGVDLIMTNATASLQAAVSATGDIPIVGTSITDYATALEIDQSDWTGATGINVTGTSDLAPLDKQADMLSELFPAADYPHVGILYCTAEPNSQYQAEVITGYLEDLGYTVDDYTFADSNDVASVTTTACHDCDVLYIPTDNTAASCTETIASVAVADKKPIIAGEEGICEGCGVATLSISYYELGYKTGEMAAEILANGADPSTMDIEFSPEVTKEYNADICDELGIEVPDDYVAIETE